jgi:hypothetical protein
MKLEWEGDFLNVHREKGDPKFRDGWNGYSSADSRLLYHVLRLLQKDGYTLCKVRMAKDGHLVDEHQQCLRPPRSLGSKVAPMSNILVYHDGANSAADLFNRVGLATYCVVRDYVDIPRDTRASRFTLTDNLKVKECYV